MEVKAISILTTTPDETADGMKFINAGFAISSDNVSFVKECIELDGSKPTYNSVAIKAYFHTTCFGIAAAIRHGLALGWKVDPEEIINDLNKDIRDAIKVMEGVKEWHEVRHEMPTTKGPSKN